MQNLYLITYPSLGYIKSARNNQYSIISEIVQMDIQGNTVCMLKFDILWVWYLLASTFFLTINFQYSLFVTSMTVYSSKSHDKDRP